jgi:hypothetical protein
MPIRCPQCGYENLDDANFCEQCGAKLAAAPVAAPLAAPVVPPTPVPAAPTLGYRLTFKNNVIECYEASRVFGREDFARYLSEDEYKYISRQHFAITRVGSDFFIEDLKSANGTKLNGKEIKGLGKQPLKPGDVIRVADTIDIQFSLA